MSIALEAAELMEHFQWLGTEEGQDAVQDSDERATVADELADIVIYCLNLSHALALDVSSLVPGKLQTNEHHSTTLPTLAGVSDEFRERFRRPERDKEK